MSCSCNGGDDNIDNRDNDNKRTWSQKQTMTMQERLLW